MASRVVYGMARQGDLPRVLGEVHAGTGTPLVATGGVAVAIVVLAFTVPFERLAEATSIATLTVFAMVNVSLLRLRLRGVPTLPEHFSVPLWVPAAGLVTCLAMMASAVRSAEPDVSRRPPAMTGARPEKPSARAAAGVTSMTRPRMNGPRSLMRTTTDFPLCLLVTRTSVPNGSVRCAAVMRCAQGLFAVGGAAAGINRGDAGLRAAGLRQSRAEENECCSQSKIDRAFVSHYDSDALLLGRVRARLKRRQRL